jgi:hypothetical protein
MRRCLLQSPGLHRLPGAIRFPGEIREQGVRPHKNPVIPAFAGIPAVRGRE